MGESQFVKLQGGTRSDLLAMATYSTCKLESSTETNPSA